MEECRRQGVGESGRPHLAVGKRLGRKGGATPHSEIAEARTGDKNEFRGKSQEMAVI